MQQRLEEFYQTSTIHGFVYISRQRNRIERIFWIVALLLSLFGCSNFIVELFSKIQSYPIVLYLSDEPTYVSQIDFPAFTFCPEISTVIDDFNFNDVIESLQNGSISVDDLSERELKLIQAISMVMHDDFVLNMKLKIDTKDIFKYLKLILRKFHGPYEGEWKGAGPENAEGNWLRNYNVYLTTMITSYGYCFTFNNPNLTDFFEPQEISENFNYDRKILLRESWAHHSTQALMSINYHLDYPVRTHNYRYGVHFLFSKLDTVKNKINYEPTHPNYIYEGNFLIIHDSYEYPSEKLYTAIVPRNKSTIFYISPSMSVYDDDLSGNSIDERKCFFDNEKTSKYFKVYRKNNCELETISSKVLETCGCVSFYMLHNATTEICSLDRFQCAEDVKENFYINRDVNECLNPCNKVTYEVKNVVDESLTVNENGVRKTIELRRHPVDFEIQFDKNLFFAVRRRKHFSNADILGLVGGFLGLFAGVSILSIIEIIFHMLKEGENEDMRELEDVNELKMEFTSESSIHGLSYIGDSKKFIRYFWIISLTISMSICGYMIHDIYSNIINNPIIVIRDDQPRSIEELDFTAVTIVPYVYRDVLHKYDDVYMKYFGEMDYYDYLDDLVEKNNDTMMLTTESFLCETSFDIRIFKLENFMDEVIRTAKIMSQRDWLLKQSGSWLGKYNLIFAEVFLRNGIAFAFNTKSFDEIFNVQNVDNFFNFTYDLFLSNQLENLSTPYPWSSSQHSDDGLSLTLRKNEIGPKQCVRGGIIVHSPNEIAINHVQSEINGFMYGAFMEILIDVDVIYADDDIRTIDVHRRKCFFEDERPLRFFKSYTYKNCQLECWFNISIEDNKCAPYFLVRDSTTRICETEDYTVVWRNEEKMRLSEKNEVEKICNCYPDCNEIEYKLEVLNEKFIEEEIGNDTVLIGVKFKEKEFLPYQKFLQFRLIDFLSTVGGLLELFAGISVLSVIEIFYFFTLRIITDVLRLMTRKKNTKVRPFVN